MNSKTNGRRWLYLFIGTAGMLLAGILYAWSILKAPFIDEFGWNDSQLSINYTLTMWCYCLSGMLAGFLIKKVGARPVIISGALIACAGFVGVSYLSGESVLPLYICYGAVAGFGIGFLYGPIVVTVSAWFQDKKGLCSGVLLMGFGASTLILGNAANYMFSSEAIGWRTAYRIIGFAIGAVLLLAGLVLKSPPAAVQAKASSGRSGRDLTTGEMLRQSDFWKFYFYFITLCAVGVTIISMARDLAIAAGAAPATAALAVGLLSLCNGLGRVLIGLIYDSRGRRLSMLLANALELIAIATLAMSCFIRSVPLCTLGFCFTGLSYGCSPTITASAISSYFGNANFAANFSVINTILIPTSLLATVAGAIITRTNSYTATFVMLTAMALLSVLLNLSIRDAAAPCASSLRESHQNS